MKKTVRTILLMAIILTTFLSCFCSGMGEPHYKYPKDLWGEWVRIDRDEHWLINSDTIKVGYGEKDNVKLKKIADGIISVTEKDGYGTSKKEKTYCLYALRTTNASISGKVRSMNSNSKAVDVGGFLGNVAVTIENSKDRNDKTQVETNSNGEFRADKLIPGEEYKVSVPKEKPITIVPSWDGEDIGTISFCDGINFKVSIERKSHDFAYYADGCTQYTCDINITNIGDKDCLAPVLSYEAEPGLNCHASGSAASSPILKTIEAGESEKVQFVISSDRFEGDSIFRKLNITIEDQINGQVWNDSVSFKFYQRPMDINISSTGTIYGVILTDNFTYKFSSSPNSYSPGYRTISIPRISSDYSLVFAGANADTEASYSVGIECAPEIDFTGFSGVAAYEPNDSEASAKTISPQSPIMAHLHKNDIDYYKFNVNGSKPSYRLGYEGPAGGTIIFESDNDKGGWKYIEVAPYPLIVVDGVPTLSKAADPSSKIEWGSLNSSGSYTNSYYEGEGRYNSFQHTRILGEDNIARACVDLNYTNNGETFSDWYLPNMGDLKHLEKFGYKINDIWTSDTYGNEVRMVNDKYVSPNEKHYCYPIRYFSIEAVAAPKFHHEDGSSVVELTCDTPDADIYYAIDPTNLRKDYTNYEKYTGPITLEKNSTIISAYAVKEGKEQSQYVFEVIKK